LVLSAVTVENNLAQGSGDKFPVPAAGGGIWSGSSLTLENGTLLQNNQAIGEPGFSGGQFEPPIQGGDASGGGLYLSGGTANLTGVSIDNNLALAGVGANAYGGGLYLAAGTLNLSSATVDGNQVTARTGGFGEPNTCAGGGLYVAGGTANLSGDTVDGNSAPGFFEGNSSSNENFGGAIYVAAGGTVTLCNDTVQNNAAIYNGAGGGLYIAPKATVYIDAFTVANTIYNSPDNIEGTAILRNC
jgi:predicted outer membrane repeat protein